MGINIKSGSEVTSVLQPEGNYYDKYNSKNAIERYLMNHFLYTIKVLVDDLKIDRILEMGCGEGHLLNFISEIKASCYAEGIDIGEKVIEQAKRHYPHIRFDRQSLYEDLYEEGSFDLVVCCEVLEHLDDPRKAMEKIVETSSDYILLSVPREPLWRVLNVCRLKYLSDLGNTPGHINHWPQRAFVNFVSEYGDVLHLRSPLPWTVVLLKKR